MLPTGVELPDVIDMFPLEVAFVPTDLIAIVGSEHAST